MIAHEARACHGRRERRLSLAACLLAFAVCLVAACSIAMGGPARAAAVEFSGDGFLTAQGADGAALFDSVDQEADCSYTAKIVDAGGSAMVGANVRVWRIAELADGFPLVSELASLPITYDPSKGSFSWQDAAETLSGAVEENGIEPTAKGSTGADGRVVLEGLDPGVYLVVADADGVETSDGKRYAFQPVITTLPTLIPQDDGYELDYSVEASLDKYTRTSTDKLSYTVRKVWDGDSGNTKARPTSVTVKLYRSYGGSSELADTVTLSAENNWKHSWTSDAKYTWKVVEKKPGKNYTCQVHADSDYEKGWRVFTATNTYEPPDNPPDNPPKNPPDNPPGNTPNSPLPKTGDVWWPVAPLACAGIVCLIIAVVVNAKRRKEETH